MPISSVSQRQGHLPLALLTVLSLACGQPSPKGADTSEASTDPSAGSIESTTMQEATEGSIEAETGDSTEKGSDETTGSTHADSSESNDANSDESSESETTGEDTETTGIDPNTDPLADIGEVEQLAEGFEFLEGPLWLPETETLIFSDIPADTIYQFRDGQAVDIFRGPTSPASNANGLALDQNGDLVVCEHSTQRVSRYENGKHKQTLAEAFMDEGLNSPNDLVVHKNGTIYFSDPTWGGTGTVGFRGVYRIDAAGELHVIVERPQPIQPNGVALSPEQDYLYLSDSIENTIHRFALDAEGVPSEEELWATTGGGGDGMAVDVLGNVYVAVNAGVLVLRSDGESWGTISFPEEPANVGFGGRDRTQLYVTARSGLYRVQMRVPGVQWPPGRH